MKKTAAYRIFADVCFYFSILSIFSALRPWQLPMALFAAACLVVSLIAVHCPYAPLRLLLGLLPGLCFLKAPLSPLLVFPGFAWLYVVLMLTIGRFFIWLDEYRQVYRVLLIICLCSFAANVAHGTVYRGSVISYPNLIYALLFLGFGVLAMREMQMNADMNLHWKLRNAASVIGVPTLAVGVSLLLYVLLSHIKPVISFIFRPVGLFVLWLFNMLFPDDYVAPLPTPTPETQVLPTPAFVEETTGHGTYSMDDWADKLKLGSLQLEKATAIGAYVVLGFLLLLAIFFIVRYVRRNRIAAENAEFIYEEVSDETPVKKRKAAKAAYGLGNAQQIRKIYHAYLELMDRNGIRVAKDSTSKDVLDEAAQVKLSASAQRLRELYLKARYAEAKTISREEVQEAMRCLKEIREEDGWQK